MRKILSDHEANQYSPLALAFVGDCVYEQKVRDRLVLGANMPAGKLHKLTVERVCAEYQSVCIEKMLDENILDETELAVFKRGRNAKVKPPKHSTVMEYRNATGLECLFGFLYFTGKDERTEQLFEFCWGINTIKE